MLRHYFELALRTYRRSKIASIVSVLVLALGLACFAAAYLFVSHLRSYDRAHAKSARSYVIMQSLDAPTQGVTVPFRALSALPLADQLRLAAPELEAIARYFLETRAFVTIDGSPSSRRVAYAEPELLEIFDFAAVAGDAVAGLSAPHGALIERGAAVRMFGTSDVVGRTIEVTALRPLEVTITGVVEVPAASHLSTASLFSQGFDLLLSWGAYEAGAKAAFHESWGATTVHTYALLPEDASITWGDLEQRLAYVADNFVPEQFDWIRFGFEARPLHEIAQRALQIELQSVYGEDWPIDAVDALVLFAVVILAMSCLNFVNLATAQAATRARSIGTRKLMGATARQIAVQELLRTALLVVAALMLALIALSPLSLLLQGPWGSAIEVPWDEPRLWLFAAAIVAAVTLVAGAYPALVLARVRASAALRRSTSPSGSAALRGLLVGVQFAAASCMLAAVVFTLGQRDVLRERLLEQFGDPYVVLGALARPGEPGVEPDVLAAELMRGPGVLGVTATNAYPFQAAPSGGRLAREPSERGFGASSREIFVSDDFFSVMGIEMLAGRPFLPEYADDTPSPGAPRRIVIDRTLARPLGWATPEAALGEWLFSSASSEPREIIGIAENVVWTWRSDDTAGAVYYFAPRSAQFTLVRLEQGRVQPALDHINETVRRLRPGRPPVEPVFLQQAFENAYRPFSMIERVFTGLALLASAIAASGLYALGSFLTARRTREIGLRKTQGARASQITRLLLWDHLKPVLWANVLLWPVMLVVADRYAQLFSVTYAITPLPLAAALAASVSIACLAVGRQVHRAANMRPRDSLRHE